MSPTFLLNAFHLSNSKAKWQKKKKVVVKYSVSRYKIWILSGAQIQLTHCQFTPYY